VVYVAYGEPARREAAASIASLRRRHDWPVAVIADRPLPVPDVQHLPLAAAEMDAGARWAKLQLDRLSPFAQTLYLDADTRICGDLSAGFAILEDGWDMALTTSSRQGDDVLGNCTPGERAATFEALGTPDLLGLQAGVFFVRRCPATVALFAAWQREWQRHRDQDQAALLRALWQVPVRMYVLGREYNGGALIEHRFGAARRH